MSFKFLYGVLEDIKVPYKAGDGVRGPGEHLGSFTKKIHLNRTTGSMLNGNFLKNMAYGGLFLGSKTTLSNFWWIKSSHILLIISMEKDSVFKKILTSAVL